MPVMQQTVQHGSDCSRIAQQLSPVLHGLFEVNSVLARS